MHACTETQNWTAFDTPRNSRTPSVDTDFSQLGCGSRHASPLDPSPDETSGYASAFFQRLHAPSGMRPPTSQNFCLFPSTFYPLRVSSFFTIELQQERRNPFSFCSPVDGPGQLGVGSSCLLSLSARNSSFFPCATFDRLRIASPARLILGGEKNFHADDRLLHQPSYRLYAPFPALSLFPYIPSLPCNTHASRFFFFFLHLPRR